VTATVTASVTVTAAATATAPDLLRMRSTPEPEPDEIPASESPTTDPDLSSALAGATVATIADRAAVAPPPPQRSHLLKRMPGGGARVDDAVTTMTVDPDGTAHFHDKGDFDFHFGPSPAPRGGLDPAELAANGLATCGLDNSGCEAPSSSPGLPPTTVVPLFTGKADLSDYLMRKLHVGDPYGARKRALLERTFDERVELGAAYRAEQLARSAELMRRNLVQLWASVHDPVARRADLFALWDECAEGDGELGQAGQRARAMVIGWIRSRLPEDSGDGYTPAEIAALERKSSSAQRFAPY
jgi:hypothetical protein